MSIALTQTNTESCLFLNNIPTLTKNRENLEYTANQIPLRMIRAAATEARFKAFDRLV